MMQLRLKHRVYAALGYMSATGLVGGVCGAACAYAMLIGAFALSALLVCVMALRRWRVHTPSGRLYGAVRLLWRDVKRAPGYAAARQSTLLVMGPSLSGKSRMLARAGFVRVGPATDAAAQSMRDLEAPSVWLGPQQLIIEMPGPLIEPQNLGRLRLVCRVLLWGGALGRLRGIVLCLEASLLQDQAPKVESFEAPLRLVTRLVGRRPPVYVMLTQLDQMPGFTQSFAHVPSEQIAGPLGLATGAGVALTPAVAMGFDSLIGRLERLVTLHYAQHADVASRVQSFEWPGYVATLKPGLLHLVARVFAHRPGIDAPLLGGIYLSGAGASVDADADADADACAERSAGPTFVPGFFAALADTQKGPLVAIRHQGLRGVWQRCGVPLSVCVLMAFLTLWLGLSWMANRQWLGVALRIAQKAAQSAPHQVAQLPGAANNGERDSGSTASRDAEAWLGALEALLPVQRQLGRLSAHAAHGAPYYLRAGLYQGDALVGPLRTLFARSVQQTLLVPILPLGDLALGPVHAPSPGSRYAGPEAMDAAQSGRLGLDLQAYLLLSAPKAPGEPLGADEAAQLWLAAYLTKSAEKAYHLCLDETDKAAVAQVLAHYVDCLAFVPAAVAPRDKRRVQAARAALLARPQADVLIDMLVARAPLQSTLEDLTLSDLLGGITSPLRSDDYVPAIFTQEGYQALGRPFVAAQRTGGEAWVLSDNALQGEAQRRQAGVIEQRYNARYIAAWQKMLGSISFLPPRDLAQVLASVVDLTRSEPVPFVRLFAALDHHTRLGLETRAPYVADAARRGLGHLKDKLWHAGEVWLQQSADAAAPVHLRPRERAPSVHPVTEAFAGLVRFGAPQEGTADMALPLQRYQQRLLDVRAALQAYLRDPRGSDKVLQLVQEAQYEVQDLIAQNAATSGVKVRLDTLLIEPLRAISKSLARGARVWRGDSYCASVVEPFMAMRHHYPFDAAGRDAQVADVLSFFRPETGQLWRYYHKELGQDILQVGDHFGFDSRLGGAMRLAYAPDLLDYLDRAQAISRALFAEQSEGMTFEVRLKPEPAIDKLELDIAGAHVPYGTSEWTTITWPGPRPSAGAQLVVISHNGVKETFRYEGAWGLFRLLESGKPHATADASALLVSWPLAAQKGRATLEVKALRRHTLLAAKPRQWGLWGPLRDPKLVPPACIARGVTRCRMSSAD